MFRQKNSLGFYKGEAQAPSSMNTEPFGSASLMDNEKEDMRCSDYAVVSL